VNLPFKTITLPAVGVDVGFISTKFSLGRLAADGGQISVRQFPSMVSHFASSMLHPK
jgi:hypothetical protein